MNDQNGNIERTQTLQPSPRISQICKAFATEWQAGRSPDLADYFVALKGNDATLLLHRLIQIDRNARQRIGETVTKEFYQQMLPAEATTVANLFDNAETDIVSGLQTATLHAPSPFSGPPDTQGRFELFEEVGRGGFGVVYRAHETKLDREVALKFPIASALMDQHDVDRFFREAKAAAHLRHPHIVPVHEAGSFGETFYISSAFIHGESLRQIIKDRGRFSQKEAAELVAKLAGALGYAHEQGIVHRDMKPGNIMVDEAGRPHIMDFGLARREHGNDLRTMEGVRMGTPAYMSPEQAKGESHLADGRSDQWALGVILYEMLTGERPFSGSYDEILNKSPAAPRTKEKTIHRDIETICLKCLEKEPSDRYNDCNELADELQRWLRNEPIAARPASMWERTTRWSQRNPAMAATIGFACLCLLLGSVASFAFGIYALNRADFAKQQQIVASQKQTQAEKSDANAKKRLVQKLMAEANSAITNDDSLAAIAPLAQVVAMSEPSSPEKNRALLPLSNIIRRAPRLKQVWVTKEIEGVVLISPNGKRVVVPNGDRWQILDSESGAIVAETQPIAGRVEWLSGYAMNPDGSSFVVNMKVPYPERLENDKYRRNATGQVHVFDIESGKRLFPVIGAEQFPEATPINNVCYSPDGQTLLVTSLSTSRLFNAKTGDLVSPFLENNWQSLSQKNAGDVESIMFGCVSHNNQMIATTGYQNGIRLWNVESGQPTAMPLKRSGANGQYSPWFVAFHPNGKFVAGGCSDGSFQVWDIETGSIVFSGKDAHEKIMRVEFNANGDRLLAWDWNHVHLVNTTNWTLLTDRLKVKSRIRKAKFSREGDHLFAVGINGVARVWDSQGVPHTPLLYNGSGATWADISADGMSLAVLDGRTIRLWNLSRAPFESSLPLTGLPLAVDGISRRIAEYNTGELRVHDLVTGREIATFDLAHDDTGPLSDWTVRFSKEGDAIAVSRPGRPITVFRIETGERIAAEAIHFNNHSPLKQQIHQTSSPGRLAMLQSDLYGLNSGDILRNLDRSFYADIGQNGRLVLSSSSSGFRLRSTQTGADAVPPLNHQESGASGKFSPDGSKIVTAGYSGSAYIWDTATGEKLSPELRHGGGHTSLNQALFDPTGEMVLTVGEHSIATWRADTGKAISRLTQIPASIVDVRFSPTGLIVAIATDDGVVQLWDSISGFPVGAKWRHPQVFLCQFVSTTELLTVSKDGSVRIWNCSPNPPSKNELDDIEFFVSSPDHSRIAQHDPTEIAKRWRLASNARSPVMIEPSPVAYQAPTLKTVEELEDEWREHFDLIRKCNGAIEDDFAFCHNMPIDEFVSLANRLATINYRVTRVRPYRADANEYVAAVWRRDFVEWRFYLGRTLDQIHKRNEEFTKQSFVPIDAGSHGGGKAFYAIWRKPADSESAKAAYFGLNDNDFRTASKAIADNRRVKIVHQKLTNKLGQGIHCIIHEPAKDSDAYSSFEGDARTYTKTLDPKIYQLDLSVFTVRGRPAYLAQAIKGGEFTTHSICEQPISTHLKLCKEQMEKHGRVPRVVNVRMIGGKAVASSIWIQRDDPLVD